MSKGYIYAKAANGMTVRIPADKYPQWKAGQEKLKNKDPEALRKLAQLESELMSKLKD